MNNKGVKEEIEFQKMFADIHKKTQENIIDARYEEYKQEQEKILVEKKNKRKKKQHLRKIAVEATLGLLIVSSVVGYYGYKEYKKDSTIDFVTTNIYNGVIMEFSKNDIELNAKSFLNEMEKRGLNEETSLYYLEQIFGEEVFEITVKSLGYESGLAYKEKRGFSKGYWFMSDIPNEKDYEDIREREIIDTVDEIKERKGL